MNKKLLLKSHNVDSVKMHYLIYLEVELVARILRI
jgi:hypothetical protein